MPDRGREGVVEFELTSVLCGVRTRQKCMCVNKLETVYDMSRGNINWTMFNFHVYIASFSYAGKSYLNAHVN